MEEAEIVKDIKTRLDELLENNKDAMRAGKQWGINLTRKSIEPIVVKYGGTPIDKIPGGEIIRAVNKTWAHRPKSNIIKWLTEKSNVDFDRLANYLGCSRAYFNNKLSRDSFSFDDFVLAAYACGYSIVFTKYNEKDACINSYVVDFMDYFENYKPEIILNTVQLLQRENHEKRAEYERKKAELEKMKAEYGFED